MNDQLIPTHMGAASTGSTDRDTLQHDAYDAVRGGIQWLTGLRRSADLEGSDPYADGYTHYENGLVSVAEGLTTLLLTRHEEYDRDIDLGTSAYSDEMLERDIDYLLSYVEQGKYPGTPYLHPDATESFTDGVSFASSVFLLTHELPEVPVDRDKLRNAYQQTIDWLIANSVDTDEGIGWSWCGGQEMETRDDFYPAQTYFTYSAIVALVDALTEGDHLIENHSEVRDALDDALSMLINEYRIGNGWIEFEPVGDLVPEGYDELKPSPSLLSTCYTIWGSCYAVNRVDSVELNDAEREALLDGINFVLDTVEGKIDAMYRYSRKYQCRRGGQKYHEGTSPYTLLNTLLEFSGISDHEADRITAIENKLVTEIVEKCWAGNETNPDAGFRHFEAIEVDDDKNVTVIYATEVAVESLLQYGIEPREESLRTEVEAVLDTARSDIISILENHTAAEEAGSDSPGADEPRIESAELEELNRNHIAWFQNARETLSHEFEQLWLNDIADKLAVNSMQKIQNVPDSPEEIHTEKFLMLLLDECYFDSDPDEFRRHIEEFSQDYDGFVLKPFRDILDDLLSLEDEQISNPIERKRYIRETLDELMSDPTGSYDPDQIANDYQQSLHQ